MNPQHQNTGFCRIFQVSSSHYSIFFVLCYILETLNTALSQLELFHFCFVFSLNIANMINEPDIKLESFFFFLPPPMDVNAKGTLKNVLYSPPSTLEKKCKFLCLSHTTFLASHLSKTMCFLCRSHNQSKF